MTAKPRPGGRSARNKAAVFEAAAGLLAERGHEAVTMTDIAERAGMAATSLYRRWGDVRALIMEVAVEKLMRERPAGSDGSLRRAALNRRSEQMERMLERARKRGEKSPDLVELLDHVLAPLYMRALFGRPISKAVADRLVDRLIARS
jgi:AcrR family transcriptional regulator